MLGHPMTRRPNAEHVHRIVEMSKASAKPKKIVGVIRGDGKELKGRDVYNIKILETKKM